MMKRVTIGEKTQKRKRKEFPQKPKYVKVNQLTGLDKQYRPSVTQDTGKISF